MSVRRPRTVAVVVLMLSVEACGSGLQRGAARPPDSLYRLEYRLPSTESVWPEGGGPHAFVIAVEQGTRLLAVTAHHALEVGGPRSLAEMRQYLRDIRLRSVARSAETIVLGDPLPVEGAQRIGGGSGWGRDVALLPVVGTGAHALRLVHDAPVVGDTLWLVASTSDGRSHRHPARVALSNDSMLVYQYLEPIDTRLTSGAAVLTTSGLVAGVNVGTTSYDAERWEQFRAAHPGCCIAVDNRSTVGIAVPSAAILRRGRLRP